MKKSLLLICALFLGILSNAQITITVADIASPITVIQQANDTLPTVTIGSPGISQTWNMSALNTHSTDTLNFISPAWAPQSAQFPGCNLVVQFTGQNSYAYASNTASAMTIMGSSTVVDFGGGPSNLIQKASPAEILTNYPSTYLSNFTQTFTSDWTAFFGVDPGFGFVIDSLRQKTITNKYSNIDAWGTITTPLVSALPCLRYYTTKHTLDTTWIYSPLIGGWNYLQEATDSSKSYSWWANGIGFPIVDLNTNWAADTVKSGSWLKATPAASINEYRALTDVNVYPNPAQNDITFDLESAKVSSVQVFDITGRLIETYPVLANQLKINIGAFINGIYSYTVIGKDKSIQNRGKFTVAK